ncbi:hypothetical protein DL767_008305 [Monosporascus sp. MG133]|nr:hypothetical protein DL767_008305 [Monosporascus sp. MG133]
MDSNEWELHRPTIVRLYLEEGYTLHRVAAYMKDMHDFDKKKSQFEYKLAKWGVRKNATRDEWQYLRRQMQKREGRISEVTIRGRIIPEHKIRRELQRYTTIPTAREFQAGLPSPKTPEGDIIRVMSPCIGDLQHPWPNNLPWFQFKELVPFKAISATIVNLAKPIPEIGKGEGMKTQQLCNAGDMNSMATQLLVVLLFRLSNKPHEECMIDNKSQTLHDSLVIQSRSHTSNAIKEAMYASAVRTSKYEIVSQLLKAGVDPNLPVHMFMASGLEIAAYRLDTTLAGILLEARATVDQSHSLLFLVAAGDNHDRTVEIAQLLVHAGIKADCLHTSGACEIYLSPLVVAIARNNNRLARFFIEKGADTDIRERPDSSYTRLGRLWLGDGGIPSLLSSDFLDGLNMGYTALQIAIVAGNITMTDQLLRPILTGSSLPPRQVLKDTLLTACLAGDLQTAEKLLGLGIELNEGWELGITPLVATAFALKSGDPATAAILYPQAELLGGELSLAVTMGNENLVSDLLSRAPDTLSSTVLEAAATSGNIRVITSFFSSGGRYQSRALFEAVHAAIISKDTSIVELLSAHRPLGPIDDYEASALFHSIKEKEWRLVHLLLRDPFLPGLEMGHFIYSFEDKILPFDTVLSSALVSNDMLVIKKILDLGYRPHFTDFWRLIEDEVARRRISSNVASLIWSFFAPSSMDLTKQQELLTVAIDHGLVQRVREWIPLVGPLDFYIQRRTPLQNAAGRGSIVLVRLFIHAGADVNTPAYHDLGVTALQAAAARGNLDIATLLIQQKADVNAPAAKNGGRTALEAAAEHGRLDMVHFLLASGARLEGPMRIHYVRSVGFAIREGHLAVAKYLKEYGTWTDRDQKLHNTAGVLGHCHFVYNEETQDWKMRWMKQNKENDWYSVANSGTDPDDDSYSESSDDTEEYANSSSQTENEIPSAVGFTHEAMKNDFNLDAFLEEPLEGHQVAMPSSVMSWTMEVDASTEEWNTEEHGAQWDPMLTEGGEGFPETFDENDFWNIQ